MMHLDIDICLIMGNKSSSSFFSRHQNPAKNGLGISRPGPPVDHQGYAECRAKCTADEGCSHANYGDATGCILHYYQEPGSSGK